MKGGYILALRSAYDLFSQVMKGGMWIYFGSTFFKGGKGGMWIYFGSIFFHKL
jgi:hypothetical protein